MRLFQFLPAAVFILAVATPSHANDVGVREISVPASERGRDLSVTVWYPAAAGGETTLVGDNRIFKGTEAARNAPSLPGPFPLVVVSHGSGGRVQAMSWLATALAEAGFIVAGPNHPGTTSGDSTPANTPKLWERTADLSAVIDKLTGTGEWNKAIDADRIAVLGFSLGGSTAMEMSGARADLDAYVRYCDSYKKWDCAWFSGGKGYVDDTPVAVEKLDLRTIDKARFEQSNLDRRIKAAVLVDPGLAQAYSEKSLKKIEIPMHFINLGSAETIPLAVASKPLAALTPKGSYAAVAGADHFSFLPECKDGAAEALKSFGEVDPICEPTERPRADIHADIIKLAREALQQSLGE
ncbi:serine aminopeptidase domain-containing protein [Ensifer sp. ENS12]|uniref:alpha/beta hydrolase family protein n=1 Tax=Ensifer sp. ENS12 TaxID=2854774 RepID=UPI001C438135|nr:alpha/beta fold hydrolase [Ensifer sp. ENS12]MBV7518643.1 alpha/beta hydrolase [Ensifer sp. ENS12]